MVELPQVTKLVNHDIVLIFFRQVDNPIIEIEISFSRATPPASFLVADRNSRGAEIINSSEIIYFIFDKCESFFFFRQIFSPAGFGQDQAWLSFFRQIHLAQNPIRFLAQKIFQLFHAEIPRQSRRELPARIHGDAQTPRPRALAQAVFDLLVLENNLLFGHTLY